MNNIIKFIKNNIFIVSIIIITILLIASYICIYIYGDRIEELPKATTNKKTDILSTVAGTKKGIYFKYADDKDGPLYMSLSSRKGCDVDDQDFDCITNIAILHKNKDEYAEFIVSKVPNGDSSKYRLLSKKFNLMISQNLNYQKKFHGYDGVKENIPLCADNIIKTYTSFDIIPNDKGQVKLVFNKDVTSGDRPTQSDKYYIGICKSKLCANGKCQSLSCMHYETSNGKVPGATGEHMKRLCLTTKESDGIFFDIEIAENK